MGFNWDTTLLGSGNCENKARDCHRKCEGFGGGFLRRWCNSLWTPVFLTVEVSPESTCKVTPVYSTGGYWTPLKNSGAFRYFPLPGFLIQATVSLTLAFTEEFEKNDEESESGTLREFLLLLRRVFLWMLVEASSKTAEADCGARGRWFPDFGNLCHSYLILDESGISSLFLNLFFAFSNSFLWGFPFIGVPQ